VCVVDLLDNLIAFIVARAWKVPEQRCNRMHVTPTISTSEWAYEIVAILIEAPACLPTVMRILFSSRSQALSAERECDVPANFIIALILPNYSCELFRVESV
jgi:hypothetical protein